MEQALHHHYYLQQHAELIQLQLHHLHHHLHHLHHLLHHHHLLLHHQQNQLTELVELGKVIIVIMRQAGLQEHFVKEELVVHHIHLFQIEEESLHGDV